jgi:SAM-dependent methyltransferase
VLDYGCGIGTDMAWMRRQGFSVEGLDGNPIFVKEARRRMPGVLVRCERFESARLAPRRYVGIWCNAALMHVPPQVLARQLKKLRRALAPFGWLGLTMAWGTRQGFVENDWIPGRYIAGYIKPQALQLFRDWRVRELRVTARDKRRGRWIQVLVSPASQAC